MNRSELYPKVFLWLMIGLLITFITGYVVSLNEIMMYNILKGGSYILLIILEIGIAIFFSARLGKMSKLTAIVCYTLYSFLTGLTFSTVFVAYKISSVMTVFLIAAVVFGLFAVIGFVTKKDVSKWSTYLLMALIGIILASIINIFIGSSAIEIVITILGILIFIGYIIFDIKQVEYFSEYNQEVAPIYGAFQLYLDFINLFVYLLRLFGNNRD